MKNFLGASLILSLLIFVVCCQKGAFTPINNNGNNNTNNNNNSNDTTKPSAVGVPTGPTVSKFIGASGGSLAAADGRVEIDIPAGALPTGDTITIQNITNSAKTSSGDAYRFLPNGLKFAVPVTIKFHYTDDEFNGSNQDAIGIAYQDSSGFWRSIDIDDQDTLAEIITAKTDHFTDYIFFKSVSIFPYAGDMVSPNDLLVGKHHTFILVAAKGENIGEVGFIGRSDYPTLNNKFIWNVNYIPNGNQTYGTTVDATAASSGVSAGQGGIPSIETLAGCTYMAPAKVPKDQNPVTLSIRVIIGVRRDMDPLLGVPVKPKRGSGNISENFTYKIKIYDGKVYRIDVVDWEDLGSGGSVNYYDSASVWIKLNPSVASGTFTYNISKDSIRNFPPVAYPTTATAGAGNCTYLWIPEPIGTVNLTSGSVYYGPYGTNKNSVFVNVTLNSTNANTAWCTIKCPNASATVNKASKPNISIPVPFIVDITSDSYSTLVTGTEDQDHIRVSLDTLGP